MNNYQIYEEIGHGRNSIVRKGRRKNTIEYYAIASYDKGQRARVNTSVQFLRTLSHRNVLKFINWYETGNHLWVITELCTGGNLRTILTEEAKLPEASVRVLAADIAAGLSYLHSRGVLYVELKPSNLLLDATGQLRFYDFGLSIVFSHADKAGRVGAPSFMAPERFEESGVPSTASDLWCFGCVLYEMATGRPPFDGQSTRELISNIVSAPFEPLGAGFSAPFSGLIGKLLHKDPAQRATWADVEASGVFANFVAPSQFPKQPHFEAFLKQKEAERLAAAGAQREGDDGAEAGGALLRAVSREARRRDDNVLRASINAERNQNRTKGVRSDQSDARGGGQYLTAGYVPRERSERSRGDSDGPSAEEGSPNKDTNKADNDNSTSNHNEKETAATGQDQHRGGSGITCIQINDTLIDGKVSAKAGASKAHLDAELDFRDPDAIDERDAGAANVGQCVIPDQPSVAPTPDEGDALPNGEVPLAAAGAVASSSGGGAADGVGVPSVVSPSGAGAYPHSPPASAPTAHPMTPMEKKTHRAPGAGGGAGGSAAPVVVAVEDLMSHPQDAHLRPLVGNNRIERYVEPRVEAAEALLRATGIAATSALQLREMSREQREAFLASIYDAMAGGIGGEREGGGDTKEKNSPTKEPLSVADKTALMLYFETLCADATVAEIVVNCSLMGLFTRILTSPAPSSPAPTAAVDGASASSAAQRPASASHSPARDAANASAHNQLRLQVATVMGMLVRHSNFIDDAVHSASLIPSLLAALKKEAHPRVRRRILACLGELLFYITSRPPAQRLSWRVDGAAVSDAYAAALRDGDDVLVHYAAKMVENTCSVADVTAASLFKFTSQPVVTALLARYDSFMAPVSAAGAGTAAARTNSFLEHLRVALACAALKLCLVDHSLFPLVLTWPTFEPATFLNEIASYSGPATPVSNTTSPATPSGGAAAPPPPPAPRHNPKVIQAYLNVAIGLFAKTITLNSTALCGHFTRSLSWARQKDGGGASSSAVSSGAAAAAAASPSPPSAPAVGGGSPSCSVFSAAACPAASSLFAVDAPVLGKVRQVFATLMPRLLKKTFLSHPSSPVRAKACLLLALLIIADECGITAPPSRMLLRALAAEAEQQPSTPTSAAAAGPAAIAPPRSSATTNNSSLPPIAAPNQLQQATSMRAVLAQLSRDPSDVVVQRCADAVLAVGQIATLNALTAFSQGKPLLPPPATSDALTMALYIDMARYCLAAPLCVAVSSAFEAPLQLLTPLGRVLHRLASDPPQYAQHLEGALLLTEVVAAAAFVRAEQQGALKGAEASAAGGGGGGGAQNPSPPIAGDSVMPTTTTAAAKPSRDGAASSAQRTHEATSSAIAAKTREVAKALFAAVFPAVLPTLEGAIERAAAAADGTNAAVDGPTPPKSASSSRPTSAARPFHQPAPPATASPSSGIPATLPPQLRPSHPTEVPFIVVKFVSDLLAPILGDADVCGGGDVLNSVYVFGKGIVGIAPRLLGLFDASSSALLLSPAASTADPTAAAAADQNSQQQQQQPNAACGAMIVAMTLRVLGALCDACPALTQELRTTAFIDNLMPVLKRGPPQHINNNVLVLLLRLLKIAPESGGGSSGGGSVRSSTAAALALGASTSSSRAGGEGLSAAAGSSSGSAVALDLAMLRHCVTRHQLLQWSMGAALQCLSDWHSLEAIASSLMEIVFLVVYAASQNTASEMAMVCGHLVAGGDATPVESLLLKICVEHPSAATAADCAASCVFLLVGLFEEARRLLVRPRVLTQIREVLSKTCLSPSSTGDGEEEDEDGDGRGRGVASSRHLAPSAAGGALRCGGGVYPHVAAPLLQSLVVLARVGGPEQLQRDELLLMQAQRIAEACPSPQLAALCAELVGYLLA